MNKNVSHNLEGSIKMEDLDTLLMNNIINAVSSTEAWKIIENLYPETERIELI